MLRSELMVAMALHLGLRNDETRQRGVPPRLVASNVFAEHSTLPEGYVYIGPGHFSHRWQVVVKCVKWFVEKTPDVTELKGKTLVCDCPMSRLCHGDVLGAAVWRSSSTTDSGGRTSSSRGGSALRRVLLATSGCRLVSSVPVTFNQETVVSYFKTLCPFVNWDKFKFPMIEDLLNDSLFTGFCTWRQCEDDWAGLPAGPRVLGSVERSYFRMSVGMQTGAASSGKAAPPLIPFGLGQDGHFTFALQQQAVGTPFELDPIVDDDLHYTPLLCRQHGGWMPWGRDRGASDSFRNSAPGGRVSQKSWWSLSLGRWLNPPKVVMWGSLGCWPCWSTGRILHSCVTWSLAFQQFFPQRSGVCCPGG